MAYTIFDTTRNSGGNNTFSNGNRTVKNIGTQDQPAYGITGYNTGKYIFSATLDHAGVGPINNTGLGLASASATSASGVNLGFTNDGELAVYMNGTTAYCNGTSFTPPAVFGSLGDRVDMAVDLTNGLLWYQTTTTPLWNADSSADPTNGINGISLSSVGLAAGTYFPAVNCNLGTSNDGEQYTFVLPPVVGGFLPWSGPVTVYSMAQGVFVLP